MRPILSHRSPTAATLGHRVRTRLIDADPPRPAVQHEPRSRPSPSADPRDRVHHGDVFVDPYEWLRDKHDADVIAYLEAENAYTEAPDGAPVRALTEAIFDEIKARTKETDLSVPTYTTHRPTAAARPTGTTCAPSRARSTRSTAGSPADERTRHAARRRRARSAASSPARRATARRRARSSSRSARSRSLRTAALLAYATDVTGDERFTAQDRGPDHRRAARRRDRRHRVRGRLGRRAATCSTPAPTTRGGRTWCCGTGSAPTRQHDVGC